MVELSHTRYRLEREASAREKGRVLSRGKRPRLQVSSVDALYINREGRQGAIDAALAAQQPRRLLRSNVQ